MRRHVVLLRTGGASLALLAMILSVGSCFERNVTSTCPSDKPVYVSSGGYCIAATDMGHGHDGPATVDMAPIPCKNNSDCSSTGTPFCGPQGICVECLSTTDCMSPAKPVCLSNTCAGCSNASDCQRFTSDSMCQKPTGACVECLSNSDCLSANKSCNTTTGMCGSCMSNSDCTSNLCCANGTLPNGNPCMMGSCIDPSSVIYVSSTGKSCPGQGQGTLMDPYCKLSDGIMAATAINSKTMVVLGGTYAENVSIQPAASATFKLYAVGVSNPVVAPTAPGPAVNIALNTASQITASFDGFTFKSATGPMGNGITCTGGSTSSTTALTIVRSTVANNAQIGINATNCTLTLDQDVIGPANLQGGVFVSGTDYTIKNSQINGNGTLDNGGTNGSDAGGIEIATAAPSQQLLMNLTIVGNKNSAMLGTPSGLSCKGTPVLFNTVVFGNTGATSEIGPLAACAPDRSVFATASTYTTDKNNYGFNAVTCSSPSGLFSVSNGLYVPLNAVSAPCTLVLQTDSSTATSLIGIGEASHGGANASTYDLAGASRPTPPAIGALE